MEAGRYGGRRDLPGVRIGRRERGGVWGECISGTLTAGEQGTWGRRRGRGGGKGGEEKGEGGLET